MSDKPAPGPQAPQKPPDAEDKSATVPAAGWNDAKTIPAVPAAAPVDPAATIAVAGFGGGSGDAATISQDLSGSATISQDLSRGQAPTLAPTAVTAQVHPQGTAMPMPMPMPMTGREATMLTAVTPGAKLAATQPTVTGREA